MSAMSAFTNRNVHSVNRARNTTSPLPAHLDDFPILDKHRNVTCTAVEVHHPCIRRRVDFHIVFTKLAARPFEPVANFLSVRAMRRAVEFKGTHGARPPAFQE